MIKRILRILFPIMGILVCVSFIRAANGAGDISLNSILVDIQGFDFSFDSVKRIIKFFSSGDFLDTFVKWDSNLTGLEGFFINIKNVVTSFFVTIGTVLSVVVRGLWTMFVDFIGLFADIFNLVLSVLGYK